MHIDGLSPLGCDLFHRLLACVIIHIHHDHFGPFAAKKQRRLAPKVTVADILSANGLAASDVLRVGQELVIPGVSALDAALASGQVHVVAAGESLLGIAVRYGVTVEEILALNQLDNPDSIFIGQELIIPGQ
jgi:LysM repeat protein